MDDVIFCPWTENEEGRFETGCGAEFEFFEDGPGRNGFKFCPYCGCILKSAERGGLPEMQGQEAPGDGGEDNERESRLP